MTSTVEVRTPSPLDLHGGISDAPAKRAGCERARRLYPNLRLLASDGTLVHGRCRATNRCDYCSRLEAVEFSEALALDALDGNAPTTWMVLTTRTATHDVAAFYESRRQVQRAVRRRWPAAEFCWVVEFTTGYGPRSGGKRRPHWNALVKGVSTADADALADVVRAVWCAREDAEPQAQFVGPLYDAGGLMRYLALHFLKESQRPPKGWSGHRTSQTRGYFAQPMWKVRARARQSLRSKRALHRAIADGYEGPEAELVAGAALVKSESVRWEAVVVSEKVDRNGELKPRLRPLAGGDVLVRNRAIRERRSDVRIRERELLGAVDRALAEGLRGETAGRDPESRPRIPTNVRRRRSKSRSDRGPLDSVRPLV